MRARHSNGGPETPFAQRWRRGAAWQAKLALLSLVAARSLRMSIPARWSSKMYALVSSTLPGARRS